MRLNLRASVAALALLAMAAACSDAPTGSSGGDDAALVAAVRQEATPLTGAAADYDPLLALTASAGFVLLGEETHGTHEFFAERARISRRLIEEQGFAAVAVEGDWPEAERIDAYAHGQGGDAYTAGQSLAAAVRFPQWMWANEDVLAFAGYIRQRNASATESGKVGFYGLDLQAMWESADAVVAYLAKVDPAAADRARDRYACFDAYRSGTGEMYGAQATQDPDRSCQAAAEAEAAELDARYAAAPNVASSLDPLFSAVMNARAVKDGEAYYRAAAEGGAKSWNARDRHMADAIEAIAAHGQRLGRGGRVVVWAHNTHVGDSRATERAAGGEVDLAAVMRQRHPGAVVLAGFTTWQGSVLAAPGWGRDGVISTLAAAAPGSYADLFHRAGVGNFLLVLRGDAALQGLSEYRAERAVGAVFTPDSERRDNYFQAKLGQQFDAVIHVDRTTPVIPL